MADHRTRKAAERLRTREAATAAKESAQTAAAGANCKGDAQATVANTTVPAVPEEASGQIVELCQDLLLVGTPVSCVSCIIHFVHHCPRSPPVGTIVSCITSISCISCVSCITSQARVI